MNLTYVAAQTCCMTVSVLSAVDDLIQTMSVLIYPNMLTQSVPMFSCYSELPLA